MDRVFICFHPLSLLVTRASLLGTRALLFIHSLLRLLNLPLLRQHEILDALSGWQICNCREAGQPDLLTPGRLDHVSHVYK